MELNETEINRLRRLRYEYDRSEMVCDPVDYIYRKNQMVKLLIQHVLRPLEDYENSLKEKEKVL